MDMLAIGKRIKTTRKSQHLTQERLAEMVNISSHYLYEIERGTKTMSMYTLVEIATALHVSIDYLVFGDAEDDPTPPEEDAAAEEGADAEEGTEEATEEDTKEKEETIKDDLKMIIESIPAQKRQIVLDLLTMILPYILK